MASTITVLGDLFIREGNTLIIDYQSKSVQNTISGNSAGQPFALTLGLELIQAVGTDVVTITPTVQITGMQNDKKYSFPFVNSDQEGSERVITLNSDIKLPFSLGLPERWDKIYLDFAFTGSPEIQVDGILVYPSERGY